MQSKVERISIFTLLGVLLILFGFWCVQLLQGETQQTYNVSFVVSSPSDRLEQGAVQAAIDYNIDLHMFKGADSSKSQLEIMERELAGDVDGILLQPIYRQEIEELIRAKRISMPVLTLYDEVDSAYARNIGIDNAAIGVELALEVAEYADTAPVVLLMRSNPSTAALERAEFCQEKLSSLNISCEISYIDGSQAEKYAEKLPEQVNLVLTEEEFISQLCMYKREGDRLFGCGFTTELRNHLESGNIESLVVWSEYDIGYMAVEQMAKTIQGKTGSPTTVKLFTATGENMYESPLDKILFPIA